MGNRFDVARWAIGALAVFLLAVQGPLGLAGFGGEVHAAEALELTIVHTNHVTGHLFPCPT